MNAIEAFNKQEENIGHLLRAADVYTQHVIASLKNSSVNNELISKIVNEDELSTLNYSWRFFLSEQEYEKLKEKGQTRKICEEIVLSVYTAIERYLIDKFKEYLAHSLSSQSERVYLAVEKRISYKSLKQIKDNYRDYLDIHLPSFEPEQGGFEESWFQPKTSWEGITLLSDARNEIAHEGTARSFNIFYLIDAYAPLHFATRWVSLFNINFDSMIYDGEKHRFVKEHDDRYEKIKT
ncbi:hypothetical protein MNBD_GAMMA04-985 [hydrothermal vent metagenome]|uniref:RiboL-PSP-HEPN domain-containing protein n=1 Tax=hydrothermal vent metagenome TaxID=652676 RepID=A0A3B0W1V1_9ZZZZ